jgi:polysaccharide export outer membrane protein
MIKPKHIIYILLGAIMLNSCIPNRKIAYLQYGNELKKPETIAKDSLVRLYKPQSFEYKLQPGDLLDVKISTQTPLAYNPFADADRNLLPGQMTSQYSQSGQVMVQGYYVDMDGSVNIPIIGGVNVSGMTIIQAENLLAQHVSNYLQGPVVRLKLLNFRFSVVGEVNKEATLQSADNYLTLLQAISMAGGATEYGDLSRVKIIRHSDKGEMVSYVNLLNEEFLSSPFYFVQPGDVIVITPLKMRGYLRYVSPNLNIFATSVSVLVTILTLFSIR